MKTTVRITLAGIVILAAAIGGAFVATGPRLLGKAGRKSAVGRGAGDTKVVAAGEPGPAL